MKKVMLGLIMLTSTAGFAQKFHIGAKAGANISNYTGGDIDTKALVGFHIGGFINYDFGLLSLQPELLFSTQGAKLKNSTDKENLKVSYVTIPVMVKLKMPTGFYIEAGPQVGFKTSEDIGSTPINTFAKSLDLSLAGGIGFKTILGLGIGARYVAGLSKVGDFDASSGIDPDFKNSVIQIGLFYQIF